jgi:hypothetical protein
MTCQRCCGTGRFWYAPAGRMCTCGCPSGLSWYSTFLRDSHERLMATIARIKAAALARKPAHVRAAAQFAAALLAMPIATERLQ